MEELIKLVEEMRNAQKEYFRTRNYGVLIRSKQLESQVDKKLQELKNQQTTLFTWAYQWQA